MGPFDNIGSAVWIGAFGTILSVITGSVVWPGGVIALMIGVPPGLTPGLTLGVPPGLMPGVPPGLINGVPPGVVVPRNCCNATVKRPPLSRRAMASCVSVT